MALKPVGNCVTITTSGSSARTAAQAQKSDTLRVCAVTKEAHVAIGTLPTATTANFYVPSGGTASISLGAVASNRVVGISTANATTGVNGASSPFVTVIDFPEGTGCPFDVGDAVTLTVTNGGGGDQSYYDFSHKCVASINTTAGVDGYFGTRCTINNDYAVGYAHTALSASNWAELRSSFMVAAISSGSGSCLVQQVQITGEG